MAPVVSAADVANAVHVTHQAIASHGVEVLAVTTASPQDQTA